MEEQISKLIQTYERALKRVILADETCKDPSFGDIVLHQAADTCREALADAEIMKRGL